MNLPCEPPAVRVVRVQDVGLATEPDEAILEWVAAHQRVVLRGGRKTFAAHAAARVEAGMPMSGAMISGRTRSQPSFSTIFKGFCTVMAPSSEVAIRYLPFDS